MHQSVGEFAIRGKQQQTGSIEIQATHPYPTPFAQRRQAAENGDAVPRIAAGAYLPDRFVIDQYSSRSGRRQGDRASVKLNRLPPDNPRTGLRNLAVNGNAPLGDPFFHLPARAESGPGQDLMEFFCQYSGRSRFPCAAPAV